MPAILMTGGAGQGKTHAAILKIKSLRARNPFARVWLLLATELQIGAFRARLLDEIGESEHFGLEFFDFPALYTRLLEIAGTPQRRIRDAARFRILRSVMDTELKEGRLRYFAQIANEPGFVRLAASFIQELKQAMITPETFATFAQTKRDHDLATIYTAYQSFLREHDLVDREGEGWLALARLESAPELYLDVNLLLIDGYDQFDIVQTRLLARLAAMIRDTLLTLTYQPERAETAHRRYAQTLQRLHDLDTTKVWTETTLTTPTRIKRSTTLNYLADRLFYARPQPVANDGALMLIEAPDARREVQWVLRAVKGLLLNGTAPEQIVITARNLTAYTPYFLEMASTYGIPLVTQYGAPLGQNPAVATLLALIDLHEQNFRRRPTIDTLHSPYLGYPDLTLDQIDRLDRISRRYAVVRGHDAWLEAIDAAAQPHSIEDDDGHFLSAIEAEALRLEMSDLRDKVSAYFDRITPPAVTTARGYVAWLEGLIGPDPLLKYEPADDDEEGNPPLQHFGLIECIRAGAEPALVARDLAALKCLKEVFFELLAAFELVGPWEKIKWQDFRRDLGIAIDNTTVNAARSINRLGRVLLATVFDVRGLSHDHIFLIGLSEGIFPAPTPEDALYLDSERAAMQQRQLPILTRAEAADESSLFYEIASLARRSLILTRPYIDAKGNEWPASPYWRSVRDVVNVTVERLPMASGASLETVAHPSELMLTLAQALSGNQYEAADKPFQVHNWLLTQPALAPRWLNVLYGRAIEERRDSIRIPHDLYSGYLSDPALLTYVATVLGPDRVWSASQFNEYGICPYRFFAKRLLKIEAIKEPEEGMDQLQLGSIFHKILEQTYRQVAAEGLSITSEYQARALEILHDRATDILATAPHNYHFRATSLWVREQETLRRKLALFIAADFSEDNPLSKKFPGIRYSVLHEIAFGEDGKPVILDGAAGPLHVRGKIDRIDESEGRVVVIDYKSGSRSIPVKEMLEGRNVQMLLYIQAAQQLMDDKQVVGGTFWHLGTRKLSEFVAADTPDLEAARNNLHDQIIQGRQGIFVSSPGKMQDGRCDSYCEFSQLCRVKDAHRRKSIVPRNENL